MKGHAMVVLLIGLFVWAFSACVSLAETPGERFRKAIEREAEYCATHKIKPSNRRCDITKLQPADPLATEEGRFAHSIKIPNPIPEDSGYKPGMTPEQYFDHLCKTEAGEFIFKTVENVEGLYMMRQRKRATDDELEHLYVLEDPYGAVDSGASKPQDYLVQPPFGNYRFLEAPPHETGGSQQARFIRYFRGNPAHSKRDFVFMKGSHSERVPYVVEAQSDDVLKSRYGYTWRGINRPHDRELGIAGSELIVLDLENHEVLGVQRRFIRGGGMRNSLTGIWWLSGQVCQQFGDKIPHTTIFISKVLKPKSSTASD